MDWSAVLVAGIVAALGISAAAYALATVGLNLQYGYAGLLNFGHVASVLVGAYGTAIAVDKWRFPVWLAFFVGVAAAVLLGLVMGLPTLRLRADYLAIVTISVAEILRLVARSQSLESVTGGPFGLRRVGSREFFSWNPIPVNQYGVWDIKFNQTQLWTMIVCWGLVAITSAFIFAVARSPMGRLLKAIREDEDATRSLGKNVFARKLQALTIGGAIGGLAGIMLLMDRSFVNADIGESIFTFTCYTMLILGGVATVFGPIVGSMLYWFVFGALESFLRQAIENEWFGSALNTSDTGAIRSVFVGLALILLMIFRPQGIFGDRGEQRVEGR